MNTSWNQRPWTLIKQPSNSSIPLYIAVGGNTGSGKSTLVRELGCALSKHRAHIALDERETHHPFLDRLFFDPQRYAYEIQLNFMIQRCLLIKRWLDQGFSLIMERSHIEDRIFVEFLLSQGLINHNQHEIYMTLWGQLNDRTPIPDKLLILDVAPEISIQRLIESELKGERPKEFPDEETRISWVSGWSAQYQKMLDEVRSTRVLKDRLVVVQSDRPAKLIAEAIVADLNLEK